MVSNNGKNKDDKVPSQLRDNMWQPGQSGNPKGRPKGVSLTAEINRLLDDDERGPQMRQALARVAIQKALQGDFRFYSLVMDRRDGKVPERLQTDGALEVKVVYEEDPLIGRD